MNSRCWRLLSSRSSWWTFHSASSFFACASQGPKVCLCSIEVHIIHDLSSKCDWSVILADLQMHGWWCWRTRNTERCASSSCWSPGTGIRPNLPSLNYFVYLFHSNGLSRVGWSTSARHARTCIVKWMIFFPCSWKRLFPFCVSCASQTILHLSSALSPSDCRIAIKRLALLIRCTTEMWASLFFIMLSAQ